MANIAQTINVLQAMILTDGPRMVLTPSYHVFEMYKVHQDATLLPLVMENEIVERHGQRIPEISASASRDAQGRVHLSLCNLNAEIAAEVALELRGTATPPRSLGGRILTAPRMDSRNDFDHPEEVVPRPFAAVAVDHGKARLQLPPMSVVVVAVE